MIFTSECDTCQRSWRGNLFPTTCQNSASIFSYMIFERVFRHMILFFSWFILALLLPFATFHRYWSQRNPYAGYHPSAVCIVSGLSCTFVYINNHFLPQIFYFLYSRDLWEINPYPFQVEARWACYPVCVVHEDAVSSPCQVEAIPSHYRVAPTGIRRQNKLLYTTKHSLFNIHVNELWYRFLWQLTRHYSK